MRISSFYWSSSDSNSMMPVCNIRKEVMIVFPKSQPTQMIEILKNIQNLLHKLVQYRDIEKTGKHACDLCAR
jgi:hypothetical protein